MKAIEGELVKIEAKQITKALNLAGRNVHLGVGLSPQSLRNYRRKDVVDWLDRMGYDFMPTTDHADPRLV